VEREVYIDWISANRACADVDVEVGVRGGVRVDIGVSFELDPQFCFLAVDCSVILFPGCSIQGDEARAK
jgi:hypothetical protein